MKIIEANVEELIQEAGLQGVLKQIERGGRICYKSEDLITEDSAKKFVDKLIERGHLAPLEHGTIYLYVEGCIEYNPDGIIEFYQANKYSKVVTVECMNSGDIESYKCKAYITTNYRVIVENNRYDDLQYLCSPSLHELRKSLIFTCDRGVSHELVRHRTMSFNQESQRYCNYSKDKYGNEITVIKPCFWDEEHDAEKLTTWKEACEMSERAYFKLLETGVTPEKARTVLPNSTKTEVLVTGFVNGEDGWEHFFKLRCSQAAHPQMRALAEKARKELLMDVTVIY